MPRSSGLVLANSSPEIVVDGKHLKLSNLDKVFYPAVGFTKAQVIDYYVKVSPYLLPHLHGRPLTLKRYAEGVDGPYFYEKQCPQQRPKWVQTTPIWSDGKQRNTEFCLANDLPPWFGRRTSPISNCTPGSRWPRRSSGRR